MDIVLLSGPSLKEAMANGTLSGGPEPHGELGAIAQRQSVNGTPLHTQRADQSRAVCCIGAQNVLITAFQNATLPDDRTIIGGNDENMVATDG